MELLVSLLHLAVIFSLRCFESANLELDRCHLSGDFLLCLCFESNVASQLVHDRCDPVLRILSECLCGLTLILLLLVSLLEDELDQLFLALA